MLLQEDCPLEFEEDCPLEFEEDCPRLCRTMFSELINQIQDCCVGALDNVSDNGLSHVKNVKEIELKYIRAHLNNVSS